MRGKLSDVIAHFDTKPARGEIVIVVGGAVRDERAWDENRVRELLESYLAAGDPLSQAAKKVAKESGWKKRDVYALGTE